MLKVRNRDRRKAKLRKPDADVKPLKGSPHLRVKVTEDTIQNAIESDAFRCWVSRTIQDQHPKYIRVSTDLQTIRLSDPERGVRYVYLTPRLVQACLVLFDKGKRMRPFVFHLRGAHTVSMTRINSQKGVSREQRVRPTLNFGRRRILPQSATVNGVVDVIGGKAAPKHPSGSGKRTFGMRAFTTEDLEVAECNPAFQAERLAV